MPGTILVVGGIKGGTGKSTTAANLAVLAARAGADVLLVDADDQATTRTWATARAERQAEGQPLAPVVTVAMTGKAIRGDLLRLAERYEVIVVDAGARDTVTQRAALSVAQVLLLPFPPRGPDLWTLDAVASTVTDLQTINAALRPIVYVNRADRVEADNREADEAFREHAAVFEVVLLRVGDRKAIAAAHLLGLAACEALARRRDLKAIAELKALFEYLFDVGSIPIQHQTGTTEDAA